jgi:peptidoglycan/LPS O-acetylase OafA/YrhL
VGRSAVMINDEKSIPTPECLRDHGLSVRADCFPPGAQLGRFLGLDAFRGFSIGMILFGHFVIHMHEGTVARPIVSAVHQLGYIGADYFLVLSGFLIGGMLLTSLRNTGRIGAWRFLGRRALRLWPSYFLVILFAWLWSHGPGVPDENMHRLPTARLWYMWPMVLHIHNYFDLVSYKGGGASAAMHTWTLMVVIHFYIAFALLMALIAQRPATVRILPWLAGIIGIICFFWRWRLAPVDEAHWEAYTSYFPTHLRIDEPMLGVMLAYWTVHCRPTLDRLMRIAWPIVILLSLAILYPMAIRSGEESRTWSIWGLPIAGLSAAGLILSLAWLEERHRKQPKPLSAIAKIARIPVQALAWIGLWSYSIYLWHQPLCNQFLQFKIRNFIGSHVLTWTNPWNYPLTALTYIASCIAVGVIMYYLVEKPSLLLRRQVLPPEMIEAHETSVSRTRPENSVQTTFAAPAARQTA